MRKFLLSLFTLCLTALTTSAFAAKDYTDEQGVQYSYSGGLATVVGYEGQTGNIVLPNPLLIPQEDDDPLEIEMYAIADDAFYKNKIIESIVIPNTVINIGEYAFADCPMLYRVHFEDGSQLYEIKDRAFANCTGLIDINIPARREKDGGEYITLPYIRSSGSTYNNFLNVPNITYPLTSNQSKGYYWGAKNVNGIVSGYLVFPANDTEKTEVMLCSTAAKGAIVIPESVTSLRANAFSGCSHVTSITIPAGVTNCGSGCFTGCSGLTSIISNAVTPPNVNDLSYMPSFQNVDKSIPVYVPEESVDAYKAAEGWKQFTNIQKITEEAIEATKYTVTLNVNDPAMGTVEGAGKYDGGSDVTIKAIANSGYQFVQWSDNETDATRVLKLTSDTTLTAVFAEIAVTKYTLTLLVNDDKMGVVSGAGQYEEGATANVAAVALTGYVFKEWSDGSKDAIRQIKMTQDLTLTAVFGLPTFTVTASAQDAAMGTVTGSGNYEKDAMATLTATANEGYEFIKWSDDNTDNPRSVVVTADSSFVAVFQAIQDDQAIGNVPSEQVTNTKVLIDGQLFIIRENAIYDARGKRVK